VAVALFYAEEDWRGLRAWNECKTALQAKGAKFNWAACIPPTVPDDQNVFAVPEMQKWFVGRGTNELTAKMRFPGWDSPTRTVVAQLTIGLAGTNVPTNSAATLQWEDPKAKVEMARLMREAVKPVVPDPAGVYYVLQPPGQIQAVQIFLQCATLPGEEDLQKFAPNSLVSSSGTNEQIRVEPMGNGSYKVTMHTPNTVREYMDWTDQLEPQLALIHRALRRPFARMQGDYQVPSDIPVPNLAAIETVAQRLMVLCKCYIATSQPENALYELSLMNDLRHMLEVPPAGKPITLVAAKLDIQLTSLYVSTVNEGLRMKMWDELALATLQQQLKDVNLQPVVAEEMADQRESVCYAVEKNPWSDFLNQADLHWSKLKKFVYYDLMPRGWVYQNLVIWANLDQQMVESFESADHTVVPQTINALTQDANTTVAHCWKPFRFVAAIAIPNLTGPAKNLVRSQTMANQTRIVCALERYHLTHGGYPDSLEAMMPRFLQIIPFDIVGGQSPLYTKNPDGTFSLTSIGWIESDGHIDTDLAWPEK